MGPTHNNQNSPGSPKKGVRLKSARRSNFKILLGSGGSRYGGGSGWETNNIQEAICGLIYLFFTCFKDQKKHAILAN